MSDIGDAFAVRKECSQIKRGNNREQSAQILKNAGISFESKNFGAHLIVTHNGKTVDFWPGTGKFIVRGGTTGRGVYNLLRLLN